MQGFRLTRLFYFKLENNDFSLNLLGLKYPTNPYIVIESLVSEI